MFQLGSGELNSDGLSYGFKRMIAFLEFSEEQLTQLGLTIIVTPQWMFLATI